MEIYLDTEETTQLFTPSVPSDLEIKKYVDDFIAKYDLPTNVEIFFDESTKNITAIWKGKENMDVFRQKYPIPFHRDNWLSCPVEKAKITFSQDKSISLETVYFGKTGWERNAPQEFLIQEGTIEMEEHGLIIAIKRSYEAADFPQNHELYGW